jgi:hypothetical protein
VRFQPVSQRGAGLFRDLKLNRTVGLVLDNFRPISHVTANGDVVDPKTNEIATTQLAVDGEVEHRQIAFGLLDLKSDTNGPDLLRLLAELLGESGRHARSAIGGADLPRDVAVEIEFVVAYAP